MIVDYSLEINGKPLSQKDRGRLKSISVVDESGVDADRLTLSFSDDDELDFPEDGSIIKLSLGYNGDIWAVGEYKLFNTSGSLDREMIVTAKGYDGSKGLKSFKTRIFDVSNVFELFKKVAEENELSLVMEEKAKSLPIKEKIAQQNESDASFLSRMAVRYGLNFKIQGSKMAVTLRGSGQTASGLLIPKQSLKRAKEHELTYDRQELEQYKSVKAFYRDLYIGEKKRVNVGLGDPSFTIPDLFKSEAEALEACKAKQKEFGYKSFTARLTMDGAPGFIAGGKIELKDYKPFLDREWLIKRVTHEISSRYRMTLDLEIPKEGGSGEV